MTFFKIRIGLADRSGMEYLDNKTSWEDVFTKELEALTKKMPTFDIESLSKSKLRLSLENKILDWKKYEEWIQTTYGCASIKENLPEQTLKSYSIAAQQAYALYSNYGFWSQDLLPAFIWENQLIVVGLQYHSNLQKIQNHIFVLAPPRIMNFFANLLLQGKATTTELDSFNEFFGDQPAETLDGVSSNTAISIDFKDLNSETVANIPRGPRKQFRSVKTETEIWDLIHDRREEYFFESLKQYDAFMALRINFDNTHIFMMDPKLEKLTVNEKLFEYNINAKNAFHDVYTTGETVTLDTSQVGLQLLNYKYITITAVKRSKAVVGFFVGFKNKQPTGADMNFLEDLSRETARAS